MTQPDLLEMELTPIQTAAKDVIQKREAEKEAKEAAKEAQEELRQMMEESEREVLEFAGVRFSIVPQDDKLKIQVVEKPRENP